MVYPIYSFDTRNGQAHPTRPPTFSPSFPCFFSFSFGDATFSFLRCTRNKIFLNTRVCFSTSYDDLSLIRDDSAEREFNLLEYLPDDVLLHAFSYLEPLDLCRMCTVSKYLQAVAEDEWLWKFILRDILVPDDDLMPSSSLPKARKPTTAADVIGLRPAYALIGPFYHSTSLNLPQHHQRRFAYHQNRGPWWKSVFRRHRTFLFDTSIPIICYRTMSYPPMASCLRSIRGPIMAVAGWKDIRIVNFRTGSVVSMLRGHTRLVTCLSGGNGDHILVSGSEDGSVRVWDTGLTTGDPIVTAVFYYPTFLRSLLYLQSSRTVIFGGDSSVIHIHSTSQSTFNAKVQSFNKTTLYSQNWAIMLKRFRTNLTLSCLRTTGQPVPWIMILTQIDLSQSATIPFKYGI